MSAGINTLLISYIFKFSLTSKVINRSTFEFLDGCSTLMNLA